MSESLGHLPSGPWEFDQAVTDCFDDMLERSIPQYRAMRDACSDMAVSYSRPGSALDHPVVLDLGCSRGEALEGIRKRLGSSCRYLGLEISTPMLGAARERFKFDGDVEVMEHDLRHPFTFVNVSVALSVLTLQFTPIEHRHRIVRDVYNSLLPGGAFILVEKVLGETAELNQAMVDAYYRLKAQNGYSQEEIERKRLSLEGRLVPVTATWNEDLLRRSGFTAIDCFWRWMNFAAWVAVKP